MTNPKSFPPVVQDVVVSRNNLSRRTLLHGVSAVWMTAGLAHLAGCGTGDALDTSNTTNGMSDDTSAVEETPTTPNEEATSNVTPADDSVAWATGGTAVMTGLYADPFVEGDTTNACVLTCAATLGPCYAETLERKDISEGQNGLPVRLAFRVVDEACAPIENATVDIWHTSATGLYSGEDASDMCTFGDEEARAGRWFRGVQITDANGRVDFDSCFPGWYSGRTIHIHFQIRMGDQETLTSQLFFDDTLTDEIVGTQPIYKDRGDRDTTNANDGIVTEEEASAYSFATLKMADGAMLASKTIVIRSVSTEACTLSGGLAGGGPGGPGGPGGGMGGPPPGFPPTNP